MGNRTPRVTAEQVTRVLRKKGFRLVDQSGSHQKWRHPETGRQTIVAYHSRRIIPPKTLSKVLEGAEITLDEFRELL